jgi:hypothetical protein
MAQQPPQVQHAAAQSGSAFDFTPSDLEEMLASVTPANQTKMLVEAALVHPHIAADIATRHWAKLKKDEERAAAEAARPQNFWSHYEKAFDQMYVKYERLSRSRQLDKGFDVAFGIEKSLATIASKTTPEAPFATKFSAIDTIREIFALLDDTGPIPRTVRENTYNWGDKLIKVIEAFSPEELDMLREQRANGKGPGSWLQLFGEMVKVGKDYCLEDDLQTEKAWAMLVPKEGQEASTAT